jgi:hypothetical protein
MAHPSRSISRLLAPCRRIVWRDDYQRVLDARDRPHRQLTGIRHRAGVERAIWLLAWSVLQKNEAPSITFTSDVSMLTASIHVL